MGTDERYMIRAVIEGVLFNLRAILEALEELSLASSEVRLIGGLAKSELWCSLASHVYGREIHVLENPEAITSLGAAIAAGVGSRAYEDLKIALKLVRVSRVYKPDTDLHQKYEKIYTFFVKLYQQLKPLFRELEELEL